MLTASITDPTGRFILVADLGMDQVLVYRLDTNAGKLIAHEFPVISAPAGTGPRHMAFHPNGRWFYVVNELSSSVSVYAYTAENGTFKDVQTVAALPQGFKEFTKAADLHISSDGSLRLQFQSRARQHRCVRLRSRHRAAGGDSVYVNRRTDAAQFRLRPDGRLFVCGESGQRHGAYIPGRS